MHQMPPSTLHFLGYQYQTLWWYLIISANSFCLVDKYFSLCSWSRVSTVHRRDSNWTDSSPWISVCWNVAKERQMLQLDSDSDSLKDSLSYREEKKHETSGQTDKKQTSSLFHYILLSIFLFFYLLGVSVCKKYFMRVTIVNFCRSL